jgi:hypothetical protein
VSECVHRASTLALESASRLNLTFSAVAVWLETLTVNLTAAPACTAAVLTRVKARLSVGAEVGVGVGVSEAELDGDGDGVSSVAARAAAVPLTRTRPVPTLMISGVRTDRASTAHDLLNACR